MNIRVSCVLGRGVDPATGGCSPGGFRVSLAVVGGARADEVKEREDPDEGDCRDGHAARSSVLGPYPGDHRADLRGRSFAFGERLGGRGDRGRVGQGLLGLLLPQRWEMATSGQRNLRLIDFLAEILGLCDVNDARQSWLTEAAGPYEKAICAQAVPLEAAQETLELLKQHGCF